MAYLFIYFFNPLQMTKKVFRGIWVLILNYLKVHLGSDL